MRRRLAVAGLAALASITFLTTACVTQPPNTGATPTPTKSATEILNDAAAKTKDQSFTYTLSYGSQLTGDGAQDATGQNANANLTIVDAASGITIKAKVLLVGEDMFLKIDLGALTATIPGLAGVGDRWMHIDAKRVGNSGLAAGLTPGGDSMTADAFIKGLVSAEKVSDTEITGTIDLAKSAPGPVSVADLAKLSPADKIVPFTATLDNEGRITKIVVKMPAIGTAPAADLITTYSGFGSAVTLQKPTAAEFVEAPEIIYQFLQ